MGWGALFCDHVHNKFKFQVMVAYSEDRGGFEFEYNMKLLEVYLVDPEITYITEWVLWNILAYSLLV